jgi:hypothetical protein
MLKKLVYRFTNTDYIVNKEDKYKVNMLVIYIETIVKRHISRSSTNKLSNYFLGTFL